MQNELFFGVTNPHTLLADYGSPLYVYSEYILRERCRELRALSSHPQFFVNYSAKANTNPHLLTIIREEGCLVDAMSPGELACNFAAGFKPEDILYVCNNVSTEEMRNAVEHGVLISVDSLDQLERFGQANAGARIMVRINPGIGAGHHQKVITGGKDTKFGIDPREIQPDGAVHTIGKKYALQLVGVNQHIGSLFMEHGAYMDAVNVLLEIVAPLKNLDIINFGGGFGIPYKKSEEQVRLDILQLGNALHKRMTTFCKETGYQGRFLIEPGRYIAAECGRVLGTVQAIKNNGEKRFVGTDIGFNILMRPIMYDSHHDIEFYRNNQRLEGSPMSQTVVGNICESGDVLAKDRKLPEAHTGDAIGVLDAGAYGFVMASNYNQRLRPAEVLIDLDGKPRLIRRKETIEDIMQYYART